MIWLYAALLVIWGNLLPPLIGASAILPGGSWPFVVVGVALTLISLAVARRTRLDATGLGLARTGMSRGVVIGALAGGAAALVGVGALLLAPLVVGRPVVYEPLYRVPAADLARHVAVFLPLGGVFPEEFAFRGALLGLLRRHGGRAAVVGSSVTFALWHVSVALATVGDTTMAAPSAWFYPAISGALVVVFGGGVVLATLRLATGTLATSIAAHWAFNATLLVGLWYALPPQRLAP